MPGDCCCSVWWERQAREPRLGIRVETPIARGWLPREAAVQLRDELTWAIERLDAQQRETNHAP